MTRAGYDPTASAPDMTDILILEDVTKRFGGLTAVDGVSCAIRAGAITGLIGPNGSGKTTLFGLISGVLRPDAGRIWFKDRSVAGLPPHAVNRLGLGRTFQISRLFGQMTALENLLVGARGLVPAEAVARAQDLLAFVGLTGLAGEYAANLSYGQQKLLEFVRVLVPDPDLILLDEPFAGVNPAMEERLIARVRDLQALGKSFLVTDHEMRLIMALCERLLVLDHGVLIADGPPEAVRADERVVEAYFGR
jgi:branched-chain amino acid transport system ATP-binding protein